MDMGFFLTVTGLGVAGLAAVLGIWMERDRNKPPRYAYALSILILAATFVGMVQSYMDIQEGEKIKEDMARILKTLDDLAAESDDPALAALVSKELEAQSRSNPDVVQKVAQRVADEGGDPAAMLAAHMDPAEVEKLNRSGTLKTKKKKEVAAAEGEEGDAPRIRSGAPGGEGRPGLRGMRGGDGEGRPAIGAGGPRGGRPGAEDGAEGGRPMRGAGEGGEGGRPGAIGSRPGAEAAPAAVGAEGAAAGAEGAAPGGRPGARGLRGGETPAAAEGDKAEAGAVPAAAKTPRGGAPRGGAAGAAKAGGDAKKGEKKKPAAGRAGR